MDGNAIFLISFQDMIEEIFNDLGTTLVATGIARMLQMFHDARISIVELCGEGEDAASTDINDLANPLTTGVIVQA